MDSAALQRVELALSRAAPCSSLGARVQEKPALMARSSDFCLPLIG